MADDVCGSPGDDLYSDLPKRPTAMADDVCGSPSYDLYSDLLAEDAESQRLETQAATTARVDEALRAEVERLKALNVSLTTENDALTTKLAAALKQREVGSWFGF